MENGHEHVSKLVKIRFKLNKEVVEGHFVFNTNPLQDQMLAKFLTMVKFRFNDAQQTEIVINMMDIDTVDYL